ncbi:MAG TPA: hypothetical protein VHG08_08865 [Longimicrobium sp.]|nr:hypothetical protein [Longimicrobium sp.]
MRYDRGYGRDFQAGRGGGMGRYDYGLRGYRQTAPERRPVGMRTYRYGGSYDRGLFGQGGLPNRVTQRYNREYVYPEPDRLEVNYAPFGGDVEGRVVDSTEYWRPYATLGGSRTWRGGGLPMGWERGPGYGGYDRGFRRYGRDYGGPMR